MLRLELREQLVDVVDVPGALDLREHEDVELVARFRHDGHHVVEEPRTVEAVHPGPELGVAEVVGVRDLDEALAGGRLVRKLDGVLEVAQQDVHLLGDVRNLHGHALVARIEEVDHPRRADRDVDPRVRRADREGLADVAGVAHGYSWAGRAGAIEAGQISRPGDSPRGYRLHPWALACRNQRALRVELAVARASLRPPRRSLPSSGPIGPLVLTADPDPQRRADRPGMTRPSAEARRSPLERKPMALHEITKGLDLPITGAPTQVIREERRPTRVAVIADDFPGMKPAMAVAEGDIVKRGQLLFEDRKAPGVRHTAPGAGRVIGVHRGAKRALLSVVIDLSTSEQAGTADRRRGAALRELRGRRRPGAALARADPRTARRVRPVDGIPHAALQQGAHARLRRPAPSS